MANQQLVDYIKGQIAAGVSKLDLEKAVASAGWSGKDATEAFAVAEGRTPPAPVAPAAPAPAAPAAPVQPQPMRPTTMQMNVEGTRRRSMWPLVSLVIILLLVGGAAAAYFYWPPVQEVIGFYLGQTPAPILEPYIPPPVEVATTTASTTPMLPPATTTSTTTL